MIGGLLWGGGGRGAGGGGGGVRLHPGRVRGVPSLSCKKLRLNFGRVLSVLMGGGPPPYHGAHIASVSHRAWEGRSAPPSLPPTPQSDTQRTRPTSLCLVMPCLLSCMVTHSHCESHLRTSFSKPLPHSQAPMARFAAFARCTAACTAVRSASGMGTSREVPATPLAGAFLPGRSTWADRLPDCRHLASSCHVRAPSAWLAVALRARAYNYT
jgi:hypothetical protein